MTKIGLLSDTHGWLDQRVFEHFRNCDEIWHGGDIGSLHVTEELAAFKPLRAVYGNIDGAEFRSAFPLNHRFEMEGMDIWMTHIGGRPGNYSKEVRDELRTNPPDLFICGHSHILKVIYDKKLDFLYMNPGAVGRHGFHKTRTMLRFDLENGNIKNLEIIELGSRASAS